MQSWLVEVFERFCLECENLTISHIPAQRARTCTEKEGKKQNQKKRKIKKTGKKGVTALSF